MFTGEEVVSLLEEMQISHVVTVPDSTLGVWQPAMAAASSIELVRVCREGEAWTVAAGLWLGKAKPLVVIQCTGLFESGDALRNTVRDFKLPLYALIGYRSYLNPSAGDTACTYTEPILNAWDVDYCLIDEPSKRNLIREHFDKCRSAREPGVSLIAEGKL